ncbi:hypothetical protein LV779_07105 [Streptomyces thinghirensis]|nr:hypothetical protein [Streptomyces thinghirensis]
MTTPISEAPRRMPGWAKVLCAVVLVLVVLFAGLRLRRRTGAEGSLRHRDPGPLGPRAAKSVQDIQPLRGRLRQLPGRRGPGEGQPSSCPTRSAAPAPCTSGRAPSTPSSTSARWTRTT